MIQQRGVTRLLPRHPAGSVTAAGQPGPAGSFRSASSNRPFRRRSGALDNVLRTWFHRTASKTPGMAKGSFYRAGATLLFALVFTAAAQEPARRQFRAGVTVTRVEVTVLDPRTRKPVTGLTADDFIVKVDGKRQPVVSVAEVGVPAATPEAAPALAEAAHDLSTNALRPSRLFVLIMNDSGGGRAPFCGITERAIAHQFIDRLGPGRPGGRALRARQQPGAGLHTGQEPAPPGRRTLQRSGRPALRADRRAQHAGVSAVDAGVPASHRVRLAHGNRSVPGPAVAAAGDRLCSAVLPRARVHVQRSGASGRRPDVWIDRRARGTARERRPAAAPVQFTRPW